jgi:thymidylate synthase (FAD)
MEHDEKFALTADAGASIAVLDHGFVRLRNIAGPVPRRDRPFDADDVDPAFAARMSFDAADKKRTRESDLKLCRYLMANKHTTPLEVVELWIEMKMPIFVARQFVRHRTVTINEVSARYVQLLAEWYVPDPRTIGLRPEKIKQGRVIDLEAKPSEAAEVFCDMLNRSCQEDYDLYAFHIERGIPPELARCFLHVNHYTHWLWKQDLHNIMHFLMLRAHSHAQYEAQQYGYAIVGMVSKILPNTMALWKEFYKMPD